MAKVDLPPIEFLRECFSYDPKTGDLRWRHRPDHHFASAAIAKAWNGKLAGTAVGAKSRDGYHKVEVVSGGRRHRFAGHRIAFVLHNGYDPEIVDHINGDPSDNRAVNLRAATQIQNRWNAPGNRKFHFPKGVRQEGRRFVAKARIDGKWVRLGRFNTPAEAHEAWKAWAAEAHGEYFNPGPEKLTVYD